MWKITNFNAIDFWFYVKSKIEIIKNQQASEIVKVAFFEVKNWPKLISRKNSEVELFFCYSPLKLREIAL